MKCIVICLWWRHDPNNGFHWMDLIAIHSTTVDVCSVLDLPHIQT